MAHPQHEQFLTILEAAASEPIGLVLMVSDVTKARAQLYKSRALANNPAFADLEFRGWPYEEGNLVICHKDRPQAPNNLGDIDLGNILDLNLE